MSWLGIVIVIIGIWLALKVAGVFFKLLLWLVVALAAWWFIAPYLGMPFSPF